MKWRDDFAKLVLGRGLRIVAHQILVFVVKKAEVIADQILIVMSELHDTDPRRKILAKTRQDFLQ